MEPEALQLLLAAIDAGIQTAETTVAQLRVARGVVAGELEDASSATCPSCGGEDLAPAGDVLVCGACGRNVPLTDVLVKE